MRRAVLFLLSAAAWNANSSLAGSIAAQTQALPALPAPPQGEAQWVARSMRINGLPMTVQVFHSRLAPDGVLHYYTHWSRKLGRAQTQRWSSAPWQMLSIRTSEHQISIQVKSAPDGSEGTITVSPAPERVRLAIETAFPRPNVVSVASLQQYEDSGVRSEHISLTSPRSAVVEARAFSDLLAREGWSILREERGASAPRGRLVEAQKGTQHALLTFTADAVRPERTAITIVWKSK